MSMNDFNLLCHVPYYIFPTSEKEKLLMKMKRMTVKMPMQEITGCLALKLFFHYD